MGLIDQAKEDIAQITSNLDDFGVEIKLTAPDGTDKTITGLHTKIHLGVSTEGTLVNSRKAHISFSEVNMTGYPLRNSRGEVDLRNHNMEVKDSTGITKKYTISQFFPDETIGLIVCIVEDYE